MGYRVPPTPARRAAAGPHLMDRGEARAGAAVPPKRRLSLLFAALAAGGLVAPISGATEPATILVCTNPVSGASWQIRIDFRNETVDSNPARISTTQISWHDATDGGNYTLDRKSGALTVIVASSTGGYFLHDRCISRDDRAHSVR